MLKWSPARYNPGMAAAKKEKSLIGITLVVSAIVLLSLAPAAEATRYVPSTTPPAPVLPTLSELDQVDVAAEASGESFTLFTDEDLSLLAALALLDAPEVERLSAENRFQLLADPGAIPRPVEAALRRKLGMGDTYTLPHLRHRWSDDSGDSE